MKLNTYKFHSVKMCVLFVDSIAEECCYLFGLRVETEHKGILCFCYVYFWVWVNTFKLMSGFTESVNDLKEVNKRAVSTGKQRNVD